MTTLKFTDVDGNIKEVDIPDTNGLVKSVNTIEPDSSGNVTLTGLNADKLTTPRNLRVSLTTTSNVGVPFDGSQNVLNIPIDNTILPIANGGTGQITGFRGATLLNGTWNLSAGTNNVQNGSGGQAMYYGVPNTSSSGFPSDATIDGIHNFMLITNAQFTTSGGANSHIAQTLTDLVTGQVWSRASINSSNSGNYTSWIRLDNQLNKITFQESFSFDTGHGQIDLTYLYLETNKIGTLQIFGTLTDYDGSDLNGVALLDSSTPQTTEIMSNFVGTAGKKELSFSDDLANLAVIRITGSISSLTLDANALSQNENWDVDIRETYTLDIQ